LSVPDSTQALPRAPCLAPVWAQFVCNPHDMLRAMRTRHGGPHLGTRLIAVVLIALLGFPLTMLVWRGASALLGALV
jgi:hypothetical protein